MKRYLVFAGDKNTKGWNSFKKDFEIIRECWEYSSIIKDYKNVKWIQIVDTDSKEIIDKFKIIPWENGSQILSDEREPQDLDYF